MSDSSEDSCEIQCDDPKCYRIVSKIPWENSNDQLDSITINLPQNESKAKEIMQELRTLPTTADPSRSEEYHRILHFKLKRIIAKQEYHEQLRKQIFQDNYYQFYSQQQNNNTKSLPDSWMVKVQNKNTLFHIVNVELLLYFLVTVINAFFILDNKIFNILSVNQKQKVFGWDMLYFSQFIFIFYLSTSIITRIYLVQQKQSRIRTMIYIHWVMISIYAMSVTIELMLGIVFFNLITIRVLGIGMATGKIIYMRRYLNNLQQHLPII